VAALLSMTGFGEARRQQDDIAVAIEVRTVNNRYFKFSLRAGEGYASLEPQIEAVVRQHVKRGTVNVVLKVYRQSAGEEYRLNLGVLDRYRKQLVQYEAGGSLQSGIGVEHLLALPGVVVETDAESNYAESAWPAVQSALVEALQHLAEFRANEGTAMASDMALNCRAISAELANVAARAPTLVDNFRARLQERISALLEQYQITLDPADLIREVSIFAERSDISEEIVRLRSHLEQFAAILAGEEAAGRKLEFVIQEMFREANTIGSKSNDVAIARSVIEIKTAIERLREMIQNVE
jgi:uncharacterized protein (TIGR00255 family)